MLVELIDGLLFVLINCRVVLSMGVTAIIKHYIVLSQFTTDEPLKIRIMELKF